jgi:adenine-specific DNA-methyltransferase
MASHNADKKIEIDSIRHNEKRANIPTEELRDFVADDELSPGTMPYPRDPSLDPQLVWKGKDEQDRQDLAVPVVPIYIQEKIHPQAIINDLIARAKRITGGKVSEKEAAYQIKLFADFNGLEGDFDRKVDFYSQNTRNQPHWSNRMILGDSLLVMTSLAEKEGLKGRVQTIYFDPPYGIKFGSNWQVSTRKRDVKDGRAEDATRQPEQIRAFRDTWQLGIHSYLAYLRDRLTAARDLLTETGSVFVQIGDENVHLVRCVLDEVFGSDNFVTTISFLKTGAQTDQGIATVLDYILWYSKSRENVRIHPILIPKPLSSDISDQYPFVSDNKGIIRRLTDEEKFNPILIDKNLRLCQLQPLHSQHFSETRSVSFEFQGKLFVPPFNRQWATSLDGLNKLSIAERLIISGNTLRYLRYYDEFAFSPLSNCWIDTATFESRSYIVQTTLKVIERCLLMTTDPGDLVLDPTCGSGTTAYVAEQWGRRWITIDTSRVALALARTRLMAARYPYYILADSPEGIRKESEISGRILPEYQTANDIQKGFVCKRVPHITLKSIANNPDIREGMTRAQIDAAIARHADSETLYDQPYEDNKRIRVCGPFSVESLSPHRVLPVADDNQDGTVTEKEARRQQDFAMMIIDNLRKAGVQNTRRGERLVFNRLDAYAGKWLNAAGEYTETDGTTKRVTVSIGPEHGTVGPMQVKEAAKEAVQGIGFDTLVVCGFAFDPHVSEEVKRYGKLIVLPAKMNPDLAMGDELLKKTGAGNLFMVFGEPDVDFRIQPDGQIIVEIKGVDVYDPTTGQIRSSSTDDIACWFIDTSYNGESFFVRQAYFTGADQPYEKLKRALRAEIDESAWNSLYSTVSLPFEKPESGKIAVKVINHFGDEVLKVFAV